MQMAEACSSETKLTGKTDVSNLRKVFDAINWEDKCEGEVCLLGAYRIFEEKDWERAKKTLSRMKEYTPKGTWNHLFFGVYDGVEKLVLHKV